MSVLRPIARRASRTRCLWMASLLTALLPVAGCADEEVDPAADTTTSGPATTTETTSTDTATSTDTGAGGGGGEGGGEPTPVLRTVEQRNPFGNVAVTDNMLWDGDFEWSSPFASQYGWLSGPPYSYDFPPPAIGADCRSGIKCAKLAKGKGLIGIGVGTGESGLLVSVYAKPKNGVCADVEVVLLSFAGNAPDVSIPAVAETPDARGWCQYQATIESYPRKTYLMVDNNSGDVLLVDDAVIRPVTPGAAPPSPPPLAPPTAERAAKNDEAREALRRLRGALLPPPNAAKRALEEHLAR